MATIPKAGEPWATGATALLGDGEAIAVADGCLEVDAFDVDDVDDVDEWL